MMMTNLNDVLVSDIRNLGLNMEERFLHTHRRSPSAWASHTKILSYTCHSLSGESQTNVKVPGHWRSPRPNQRLEETPKWSHVLHQIKVWSHLNLFATSLSLMKSWRIQHNQKFSQVQDSVGRLQKESDARQRNKNRRHQSEPASKIPAQWSI